MQTHSQRRSQPRSTAPTRSAAQRTAASRAALASSSVRVRSARGTAARTSATCGPRRPADRCTRRTAAPPPATPPRRHARRPATVCAATSASTTRLTSWNTAGNGETRGAGQRIDDRDGVEIQLDRAGALRQAGTLDHRGVQLPGVPDDGRRRRVLPRSGPDATAGTARPAASPQFRWRAAMIRTASNASAASARRPSPHGPRGSRSPVNTAATCWGCRGSDASSTAISSSVGRRSTGISSTPLGLLGRLHHLRDGEQRDVDDAARDVARQRLQQARQQGGGQMRPIGLQRVEHLRGVARARRRRADPRRRTPRPAGTASAGSRRSPTAPATCRSRGGGAASRTVHGRPEPTAAPTG